MELSERFIMSLLLVPIAGVIATFITGLIDNFIIDRNLVGIIGVILFSLINLYWWLKSKFIFGRSKKNESQIENKSIIILLTIASFGIIYTSFYIVLLYFYGN